MAKTTKTYGKTMIDKPTVHDRPVKKQIPPLFNNRSNRNMRQAQKKHIQQLDMLRYRHKKIWLIEDSNEKQSHG